MSAIQNSPVSQNPSTIRALPPKEASIEKISPVSSNEPSSQVSRVKTVAKQAIKFLARVLIFTLAIGVGALLGSLIPIPVAGTAAGAAAGLAAGFAVHNKVMSLIENINYFKS